MKTYNKIDTKLLAEKMILKLSSQMYQLKLKRKLTRDESRELQRLRNVAVLAKNAGGK